jgi:mannosyl-glycoprotein endo-beta-N-acetylglucosaminidase
VWIGTRSDQSANPVLIMHDMAGGYLENQDLYPAGVSTDKLYTFTEWQYIDTFVYFSHRFVSYPPPGWTNSAHRNGVKCLGTIIVEKSNDPEEQAVRERRVNQLLSDPELRNRYVAKLAEIARAYKFDGYLVNIEIDLQFPGETIRQGAARAKNLKTFVTELRVALKHTSSSSEVIWYDSVNPADGIIDYQNELNGINMPYFRQSDGIVTNYFWGVPGNPASPETSAKNAGHRALDVYTGVDAFDRNDENKYWGFSVYEGVGASVGAGTSTGIFAPAWTYESADADKSNFPQRDREFWVGTADSDSDPSGGIAQYVAARPIPSALPFVTDFNRGFGAAAYDKGVRVSRRTWGNVGSVDVLLD